MSERSEGTRPLDPFGLTGSVLDRKYRIDKVVAEGGFGVVFAGHHLVLDTRVAVKVLKTSQGHGPRHGELIARFLTEARTMARLRHPHIVSVLDSGVHHVNEGDGGVPWIVFEWLHGDTLRTDLERRRGKGGRTPEACLELMRPVLDAIAYAHNKGIAHRDIKPSNIVLVRNSKGLVPRVLDFGIAKVMERDEQPGTGETATRGRSGAFSAKYAAPEQVSGARTGPWTDVHALGLLLTEMLIDQSAYPSDDSTEICSFVFDAKRPTPGRFGVDVGVWEPILERALALKPTDRHPTAAVLLQELEAALGVRSVSMFPGDGPVSSSREEVPASYQNPPDSPRTVVDRTFETLVTGPSMKPPEITSRGRSVFGMGAFIAAIAGATLWVSTRGNRAETSETPKVEPTVAVAAKIPPQPALASSSTAVAPQKSAPETAPKPEPTQPPAAEPVPGKSRVSTSQPVRPLKSRAVASADATPPPAASAAAPPSFVTSPNVPGRYVLE